MSDLQDLIHKTSMDCLAKGKQQERERIIKMLEEKAAVLKNIEAGHGYGSELNSIRTKTLSSVIELIKAEN